MQWHNLKLKLTIYKFMITKTSLTSQEETVFNIIRNNYKISKKEIGFRIDKSEKTVQLVISSLIGKGLIEREGSNRTGFWKIKNID